MNVRLQAPRPARDSERGDRAPADTARAPLDGPAFYSDETVVARYRALRDRPDGPAKAIEEPIVLDFLGELEGRQILDLGCGDASLGRHALDAGASRYLGLDGSPLMLEEAERNLEGTAGEVRREDLEWWCGGLIGHFDVVVSRLALQHVANLARVFEVTRHHLKPSGLFVFSVEHPLMTSSYHGEVGEHGASAWHVYDYFHEGERADHWLDAVVRKQHRTLETYVGLIRDHGLLLDRFSEGRPDPAKFPDRESYEGRLDVPMCAIFRCIRNG